MRSYLRYVVASLLLALVNVTDATKWVPDSTVETDSIAALSLALQVDAMIDGSLNKALTAKGVAPACNPEDIRTRREYANLSDAEKLEYTRAVKCLMDLPSQLPEGLAPGAKSRYDDFVVEHVVNTLTIHNTGNFLHWHRYYIFSFETALRRECGFTGHLPYWNWAKSASDPINSVYFDGSDLSQGGNGVWAPHNCTRPGTINAPCLSPVVEGRGGGCVETGPYVGYQANLSALALWFDFPQEETGTFLGYSPRCMRRDIMPEYTRAYSTEAHYLNYFTNSSLNTLGPWQDFLQGSTGLHGIGHFTYGGDPGGDFFISPNDPMFWLHHGMVDRSWWMWQNQKPVERLFQISGTRTMFNDPPSENATIEDILDITYVMPKDGVRIPLKHHVSTVAGPYCYVYE